MPAGVTCYFFPFFSCFAAHMSEQMTSLQYIIKSFAGYATRKFQHLSSIFSLTGTRAAVLFITPQ
jgi:hypothetical protein